MIYCLWNIRERKKEICSRLKEHICVTSISIYIRLQKNHSFLWIQAGERAGIRSIVLVIGVNDQYGKRNEIYRKSRQSWNRVNIILRILMVDWELLFRLFSFLFSLYVINVPIWDRIDGCVNSCWILSILFNSFSYKENFFSSTKDPSRWNIQFDSIKH